MCVTEQECVNAKNHIQVSDDGTIRKCIEHYTCIPLGHRCVTRAECLSTDGYTMVNSDCVRADLCVGGQYIQANGTCVDED